MCMIVTLSGLFHPVSVSTPYLNYRSLDTVFTECKFIAGFWSFPHIVTVVFVRTIGHAQKLGRLEYKPGLHSFERFIPARNKIPVTFGLMPVYSSAAYAVTWICMVHVSPHDVF